MNAAMAGVLHQPFIEPAFGGIEITPSLIDFQKIACRTSSDPARPRKIFNATLRTTSVAELGSSPRRHRPQPALAGPNSSPQNRCAHRAPPAMTCAVRAQSDAGIVRNSITSKVAKLGSGISCKACGERRIASRRPVSHRLFSNRACVVGSASGSPEQELILH